MFLPSACTLCFQMKMSLFMVVFICRTINFCQIIDKNCNFVISSRNRNCKITFAQKLHLSRVCHQKKRQNLHWQCQSMIYGKPSSILDANSLLHKITFSLERFCPRTQISRKSKSFSEI